MKAGQPNAEGAKDSQRAQKKSTRKSFESLCALCALCEISAASAFGGPAPDAVLAAHVDAIQLAHSPADR